MVYVTSPFPWQDPPTWINYHNALFKTPEQLALPDYVMYINAATGKEITRYQFVERMYDAATALAAPKERGGLGLGKDSMVALLSDNCIDYCVIIHALLAITTPFAPISSYATEHELKHYLDKSKATHIFVHESFAPKLFAVARQEGFPLENIFILEGKVPAGVSGGNLKSLESLIQHVRATKVPREPVRPAGKDTLAYLVFSSGTSGLPKAVMISHGNLLVSLISGVIIAMETLKIRPLPNPDFRPVTLGFLPLFHSFGLQYLCLKTPVRPGTVILIPRWNLDAALECIPKYRITHLGLIPSVIHSLSTSPKTATTDMSSIIAVGSGAAYLPPSLSRKFSSLLKGVPVNEGYGMSECTISTIHQAIPGLLNGAAEADPLSTGVLVPGMEAVVLRSDGTHCNHDEPGDLYVKGGNVALGYWNDPKATKETFLKGGWLRTGDRFRVNSRGTFYFADRAKDTLKVSGMQVAPAEIEGTILAEPSGVVHDVAVAGVQLPTARTSDDKAPRAWVVLTMKGKSISPEEAQTRIEEWVKKCLSKYKWLRGGIEFVDDIPKNPTGKILRRTLTERYEATKSTQTRL